MAGLAAARVVVAAVGDVFTTLHETAKHVGGQTIKFNKSILKSLEPKKKKKRKSLESTSDGAPEVENLRPEKNDMSSSKPSSQILMYMMHGYDKIGNVTVSDTSRVHVGYEYKCAR